MSPHVKAAGREWLIFLALSNYKVDGTKAVRDCCQCTGLMFPARVWLNVGSGCRSHAAHCFHILCSLSNGLLKTGCLLFWPPRLQSGMPLHCFPSLVDGRRGRRHSWRWRREWNLPPPPLSVISRRQVTLGRVKMQTVCMCASALIQREQRRGLSYSSSHRGVIGITATHKTEERERPKSSHQPNISASGLKTQTMTATNTHVCSASQPPPSSSPHFSKHCFSSSHHKQKSPIVPRATSWHMPLKTSPLHNGGQWYTTQCVSVSPMAQWKREGRGAAETEKNMQRDKPEGFGCLIAPEW